MKENEMSLDIWLEHEPCPHCRRADVIWVGNITHNLSKMATAAGLHTALWRPETFVGANAYPRGWNVFPALLKGQEWLQKNPAEAIKHNPPNGWGSYETLVEFVSDYIYALSDDNEGAIIKVSR
jgi:hypothetical protein